MCPKEVPGIRGAVEGWCDAQFGSAGVPMIYTVGYEGRTAESLVELLRLAGADLVVDVRLTPISRKPGLSKTALSDALGEAGIDYVHDRRLGNPRENREGFRTGDVKRARSVFRRLLSNGAGEALEDILDLAEDRKVALLCYERDADRCHRQVIAEELQRRSPAVAVVALS